MRTLIRALVVSLALGACQDLTIPDERDTAVDLAAMPQQAAVGEEIDFEATAEGQSLARIVFYFGDGDSATAATFGAQEASANESHSYTEAGTFTASAVAVESFQDSARAEVTVTITEAAGLRR